MLRVGKIVSPNANTKWSAQKIYRQVMLYRLSSYTQEYIGVYICLHVTNTKEAMNLKDS